ncbi:MAG: hypothetical protein ACC645_13250 [Pirellulales bacterium]
MTTVPCGCGKAGHQGRIDVLGLSVVHEAELIGHSIGRFRLAGMDSGQRQQQHLAGVGRNPTPKPLDRQRLRQRFSGPYLLDAIT